MARTKKTRLVEEELQPMVAEGAGEAVPAAPAVEPMVAAPQTVPTPAEPVEPVVAEEPVDDVVMPAVEEPALDNSIEDIEEPAEVEMPELESASGSLDLTDEQIAEIEAIKARVAAEAEAKAAQQIVDLINKGHISAAMETGDTSVTPEGAMVLPAEAPEVEGEPMMQSHKYSDSEKEMLREYREYIKGDLSDETLVSLYREYVSVGEGEAEEMDLDFDTEIEKDKLYIIYGVNSRGERRGKPLAEFESLDRAIDYTKNILKSKCAIVERTWDEEANDIIETEVWSSMKESVEAESLYLVFGKGSEGKRKALADFDSLEDAKAFAKEHCGRHGVVVERTWDGDVEVWSSMKESVAADAEVAYIVWGTNNRGERRGKPLADFDSLEDAKAFAKEHCGSKCVITERTWANDELIEEEVWSSMKESVEEELPEESVEEVEIEEVEEESVGEEDLMSLISDFLDKYDIEDSEDLDDIVAELDKDNFVAHHLFDISHVDEMISTSQEDDIEEDFDEELAEVDSEDMELSDEEFIDSLFGGKEEALVDEVVEESDSLEAEELEEVEEELDEDSAEDDLEDDSEEDLLEKKLAARKRLIQKHKRNIRESEFRRMELMDDSEDEEDLDIDDMFSEAKRYECPRPTRYDDGEGISLSDMFKSTRDKNQKYISDNTSYLANKRAKQKGFGVGAFDIYTSLDDDFVEDVVEDCIGDSCEEVVETWASTRRPKNDTGYVVTKNRRDIFEEELEEADIASRTAVSNRALERRADLARIRRHTESLNNSERTSKFREALNSSSRVQESTSVESNSWAANKFIDRYNESKEFCFEDLLKNGFLG